MLSYRYSKWDGAQDLLQLEQADILAELSDHLLSQGDVQSALRMMMQKGMRDHPMMGLQEMLQRLRTKRQQTLDKYNMGSVVNDLRERLDEIIRTEREGIEQRLDEAQQRAQSANQAQEPSDAPTTPRAEQAESSSSQASAPSDGHEETLDPEATQRLAEFLEQLAEQKRQFLDTLPEETGNALRALSEYDFLDPEATRLYDELMEEIRQQVMQSMLQQMNQGGQNSDSGQMQGSQEMLQDLNQLLKDKLSGSDTSQGYQQFREKWGPQLGQNPPQTLEEFIAGLQGRMQQMQSLMESISNQQRQDLDNVLENVYDDMDLQQEMAELANSLAQLYPQEHGQRYPFRGEDSLDLQEAMRLLQELGQLEELEKALRKGQYGEGIDDVDLQAIRDLLGEEEAQSLEAMKNLTKVLEDAGYVRRDGERLELTPRGMRLIGQKALRDIFDTLKQDRFGNHQTRRHGGGLEPLEEPKHYEYGDPFFLDLHRTVRNAIERGGPGVPVTLQPADFEVFRTERQTQSSTVLMLDLSWSMARRGSFYAAKKVILALHNLIRTQFPRDAIYIVGFSTYARELKAEQLPYITWDQAEPYTNMQQGFMISQKLLSRHKSSTRQILMISDGEPTAHIERGQVFLGYPPSPRTITETLREVRQCTREGIIINVFMLDKSYYLKEFVDQITKINRGRAFYTSPETLGQYVMVDYLTGKRRRIA